MSIHTDKYGFIIDIQTYIIKCVEKSASINYAIIEGSMYESWIWVIGKKNKAENCQKIEQVIHRLKLNDYFDAFCGEVVHSLDKGEPTFKVAIKSKVGALKLNRITHKLDNTYTLLKLKGLIA